MTGSGVARARDYQSRKVERREGGSWRTKGSGFGWEYLGGTDEVHYAVGLVHCNTRVVLFEDHHLVHHRKDPPDLERIPATLLDVMAD